MCVCHNNLILWEEVLIDFGYLGVKFYGGNFYIRPQLSIATNTSVKV
jgi:hypothetical protein